jgi:hypothetical protein
MKWHESASPAGSGNSGHPDLFDFIYQSTPAGAARNGRSSLPTHALHFSDFRRRPLRWRKDGGLRRI